MRTVSEHAGVGLKGAEAAKVFFVGAGPGAADLLTFRGAAAIAQADIVIFAGSLVDKALADHARADAEIVDSSTLTLEDMHRIYQRALDERLVVARLHSGDPALYGAIGEQIACLDELGIDWEIIPGVSSLAAAAAALGCELTVPGKVQSVVVTRLPGRTPVPTRESVRSFAAHRATMALFLSCARAALMQRELLAGGYPQDTPCGVVHRASWPDQTVLRCELGDLASSLQAARIHRSGLVLVGEALRRPAARSKLYDPAFGHRFRRPTLPGGH